VSPAEGAPVPGRHRRVPAIRNPGAYQPDQAITEPLPVVGHRRGRAHGRSGRHRLTALVLLAVLALTAGIVGLLAVKPPSGVSHAGAPAGTDAATAVVFSVSAGETLSGIGQRLVDNGVIESSTAFTGAAQQLSSPITGIEPGFYALSRGLSAGEALSRLGDPLARVGLVEINAGAELEDRTDPATGDTIAGIFTTIARASCIPTDDQPRCVSVDRLRASAAAADLDTLRIPVWARDPVASMAGDPGRLNGLVAAGRWNFDPAGSPAEILGSLIEAGARKYAHNAVLEGAAAEQRVTVYQMLIIASVLQADSTPADYPKLALTIYDRLRESTDAESLSQQGPVPTWNAHVRAGLPATPVGAPGDPAIAAAQHP
jgi:UPF0755 protein